MLWATSSSRQATLLAALFTVASLLLLPATARAEGAPESTVSLPPAWVSILASLETAATPGQRISRLSHPFLGTTYQAQTLIGDADQAEQLVANFTAVDCFTLLDYVEALRRTHNPADFANQLVAVRYHAGQISWTARRHFFTDWAEGSAGRIVDVTGKVGGHSAQLIVKELNQRDDGSLWLPGLPVIRRTLTYLPTEALDGAVLSELQVGDYLGIYSPVAGLDVSHTGILVRDNEVWQLRHASSQAGIGKVVDTPLLDYLVNRPGLIILRPY